ncbi:MAG: S8 family serine peptidase [Candidatus Eremiobacteraeota bacterium]|nr:S8 family serine peptidase [Candidatus Eremiobacteraeota bacterium]
MKRRFLAAGLLISGCGSVSDLAVSNPINTLPSRPATLLVKYSQTSSSDQKEQASSLLQDASAATQGQLPNSVQIVEVAPSHEGAEQSLCEQLMASGAVEFAEPDYLLPVSYLPNDPYIGQQWALPKISAPAAWDLTRGKSSVTVAVCDTGVLSTHPDLSGNLVLPGFNSVDGSDNIVPIHPHGTMVSGCIAASANNGQGVAGVAFGVRVLPVRVSNKADGSAYLSDMANGVRWAADHGARVINLSYGGAQYATIDQAAQYARTKNSLLFMAAGNDGQDISSSYPDYPSFVLVGATNSSDARSSFSNYGTAIDMVAPGESIVTTTLNNGYASVSGTSFASPITAAGAALMLSANPNLTVTQLESKLMNSCDDLGAVGEDSVFGKGRLNLTKAVREAAATPVNQPPRAVVAVSPGAGVAPLNVTFSGASSSDPEGETLTYSWSFSEGGSATGVQTLRTYSRAGSYTAILTVTDPKGATAVANATVTVSPAPTAVAAPTGLVASGTGNQVNLSWKDNSNNELGFYVERANQLTAPGVFTRISTVAANATSFSQTVTKGNYLYRVQAYNASKTSDYSTIISVNR